MLLLFSGGRVWRDGAFAEADVLVEEGRIAAVGLSLIHISEPTRR